MVAIKYKLQLDDYLTNQLYIASLSERVKKKRKRANVVVPVIYVVLAVAYLISGAITIGLTFVILAVLWIVLYPRYQKRKYYKHYQGFVNENYMEGTNLEVQVELIDEVMIMRDANSQSQIKIEAIEYIAKLPSLYLVNLGKVSNLVVPHNDINNESIAIDNFMKTLISEYNIELRDEKGWLWK